MLKNDTITLTNQGVGTQDIYGNYIPGIPVTKTMRVNVQPYSRELLLKAYGYDIEVTKRVMCEVDTDIKEGSIITYKGIDYEVKKIPWDIGHMEVFCHELY